MNNRLINTKVAGGGGGCTDIVDNYDPFGGNGVALYQLNGNATDSSPSANNGTLLGTGTYGTGVFGQAYVNNNTSGISCGSFGISGSSATFSASMWVKFDTLSFAHVFAMITGSNTVNSTYALSVNTSGNFYIDAYGSAYFFNNTPVVANQWYHIVGVSNASNHKLYINGSFAAEINQSLTFVDNFRAIGGRSIDNSTIYPDALRGSIDQVRIFNTALTPLEIEALYTEELCICDGTVDTLDILGDGSCIATYQLDGNADDLSGNYSGTPYVGGSPSSINYGAGEFDLAANFNGTNEHILLPNNVANLNNTTSLSFWFKTTTNASSDIDEYLFALRYGYPSYLVRITTSGKIAIGNWGGAGSAYEKSSTSTVTDGQWRHFVFTYNGTNAVCYIDGVQDANMNWTYNFGQQLLDNQNRLGGFGVNSRLFTGSIDQVRIFNKALNSTEVTTLYNETTCANTTREAGATQILGDSSCVAYYKLDGDVTDETGTYDASFVKPDYRNGEFNLAANFNSVNNYALLPFNLQGTPFSISFWAKDNSSASYWIANNSGSTQNGWHLTNGAGTYSFRLNAGATDYLSFTTTGTINQSVWHHVVATWDNTTNANGAKIYVNGVLNTQATSTSTSNFAFTNSNITIMKEPSRNVWYGNGGKLDQLRFFNKAVSASEVTTLYNEGI